MSIRHDQQRRSVTWDVFAGPRNYLLLVGTQFLSSLASLLTVWLLTQLLGAEGYGQVAALIAAAMLVGMVALNWSAMALARIGCEEFVETGRITDTFWTRTGILLLNWLLVLVTAPLWFRSLARWLHLSDEMQFWLLIYLLSLSAWMHVQYGLQAAKLQGLVGRLLALERLLILVGAIFLALNGASLTRIVVAYAGGALAATLCGLWRLRHLIGRVRGLNLALAGRVILFSLPLIPQSLVSYFSTNYLDAWFILHYRSPAELGVYSLAYQLAGTAMQLPVLASSLLLPMFTTLEVKQDDQRLAVYARDILPVLSLGWAVAGTFITGALVVFLPLVFGAQFAPAVPLIWPLMAASGILGPWSMGYGPLLNAKSATTAIAVGALVGAGTNVLLNFALIPRWGLLGCAWATVVAYLINLLVGAYLLWRVTGLSGGWALVTVLPPICGAVFAGTTGQNGLAFLLTLAIIFCLGLAHRATLLSGGRRLYGIWARKYELALLPESHSVNSP